MVTDDFNRADLLTIDSADTVVQRILYTVDSNDDGKISQREFKKSDFFSALEQVDLEEDINKVLILALPSSLIAFALSNLGQKILLL